MKQSKLYGNLLIRKSKNKPIKKLPCFKKKKKIKNRFKKIKIKALKEKKTESVRDSEKTRDVKLTH